ncbi:MAG: sigma-54-dependent Fis family transcriptional regulator [Methylococcales bacterium]|nr:sigma-54-dependent Fis family transcriptional regulator [Methylococcales bacterium]
MDTAFKIPSNINSIQESFLLNQPTTLSMDRPVQAWQWMMQSRTVPDYNDWVRAEVIDAWHRCLKDHQLPLGNYANWDRHLMSEQADSEENIEDVITEQIKQLDHHFQIFLQEAGVLMTVVAPSGRLLYASSESYVSSKLLLPHQIQKSNWQESVLGNNGIGSAITLRRPVAFQGMEHYLSILHPYTTVGYPIFNEDGQLLAVIGLISDHQEKMSSLFAFLHLICVVLNTNLPITKSQEAQVRVLEKISFRSSKKASERISPDLITDDLRAQINKSLKLQKYKMPILITGESGVGKDHFVNLIKEAGPRKEGPLIAINCASIPHELIESELFGYEAGSFTGAKSGGKPGKFKLADKGILFLDEIGDMSIDLQSTLLRVLETSEFTSVGGSHPISVDVQIIAATNVQLLKAVEAGRFRRDLYYRLNGAQIHLPPLRERVDKNQIIHSMIQREIQGIGEDIEISLCPEVISLFEQHPWPGNIRQLINVIRATIYTAPNPFITKNDLPIDFMGELAQSLDASHQHPVVDIQNMTTKNMSLADWEKHGIKAALTESEGNITAAAKRLGITRTTLYKKIERFGLGRPPRGGESISASC